MSTGVTSTSLSHAPAKSGSFWRCSYIVARDRSTALQADDTFRFSSRACRKASFVAAPRSAFLETPDFALASLSPETFLRAKRSGELETWPFSHFRFCG